MCGSSRGPLSKSTESDSKPFASPKQSVRKRYLTKGWLARHIDQCNKISQEALAQAAAFVAPVADDKARLQVPGCPASKCPLFLKVLPI